MIEIKLSNDSTVKDLFDKLPEGSKSRKDLSELFKRNDWLTCLENAGVDNWQGIDVAHDMMDC